MCAKSKMLLLGLGMALGGMLVEGARSISKVSDVISHYIPKTEEGYIEENKAICESIRDMTYEITFDSIGVDEYGREVVYWSEAEAGAVYGLMRYVRTWERGDVIIKYTGELNAWRCLGGGDTCIRQRAVRGLPCAE